MSLSVDVARDVYRGEEKCIDKGWGRGGSRIYVPRTTTQAFARARRRRRQEMLGAWELGIGQGCTMRHLTVTRQNTDGRLWSVVAVGSGSGCLESRVLRKVNFERALRFVVSAKKIICGRLACHDWAAERYTCTGTCKRAFFGILLSILRATRAQFHGLAIESDPLAPPKEPLNPRLPKCPQNLENWLLG